MRKVFSFFVVFVCFINMFLLFNNFCFAETKDEFIQVSAGESHCIALKSDGTVWAWGRGIEGQLGNGRFQNSTIPVQVEGLENISKISAGGKHNLAMNVDGEVWSWGCNNYGQLGNGSHGNRATPVQVDYSKCSPYTIACNIEAGYEHSLILTYDTVLSFGRNKEGQLGDSSFGYEKQRVGNVRGFSYKDGKNINCIAAGGNRSYLGVLYRNDDNISSILFYGWGENIAFEPKVLSENNIYGESCLVAGGNNYAIAYKDGFEYYDNDIVKSYNLKDLINLRLGYDFGLALDRLGNVYTFGNSFYGDKKVNSQPVKINISNIKSMTAGKDFAVFIDNNGSIWGLGANNCGQLGTGDTKDADSPVSLKATDFTANDTAYKISVGNGHNLFIKKDGTVWAWGENTYGQLGNGNNENSDYPVQVDKLTDVAEISAGDGFSVAIKKDGTVWAWGKNNRGQLGNGTKIDSNVPVQVNLESQAVTISAGYNHVLMVDSNEIAWSWGANDFGQLGDKSYTDKSSPVKISLTCVKKVSAGNQISMLLKKSGILYTFGKNDVGQLGGERQYNNKPVEIDTMVKDISAGFSHILALKSDGTVYACGNNRNYTLGIFTAGEECIPTLTQVPGLKNISKIVSGENCSFALTMDGKILFWGEIFDILDNKGTVTSVNSKVRELEFGNIKDVSVFGSGYRCLFIGEDESIKDIDGNMVVIDPHKHFPDNGSGVLEDPYLIYNVGDFDKIKNNPNAYYKVMSDIDFKGSKIKSIGDTVKPFKGTFDGNGYCLSNFKIEMGSYMTTGNVFAYTENADIKNLKLIRVGVSCSGNIGALIGSMTGGSVSNCSMYTIGQNVSGNTSLESAFVYRKNGKTSINNLNFGNLETLKGFEKTVPINRDKNYDFILTSEGNQYVKAVIYTITYDTAKIKITGIGKSSERRSEFGIEVDKDIEIISHANGTIKFRANRDERNWSGILGNIKFKALTDGETTIKLQAE